MRIWADTFNVTTPDDTSIVVRRDFDAPSDKVWRALTEPEHLRRWLGDPSFPLTTCEMDVRVGGSYRWVFTQPDGPGVMGVRGTYDEVDRPHRIVSTEQFDDFPSASGMLVPSMKKQERLVGMVFRHPRTVEQLDAVPAFHRVLSG